MRIFIILLALIIVVQTVAAETMLQRGSIEYGGSVSYLQRTYDEDNRNNNMKVTTWNAAPQFGYFYRTGLSIGFDLLYSHITYRYSYDNPYLGNDKSTSQELAIGPQVIVYFRPSEKHTPFAVLGGRIGRIEGEDSHAGTFVSESTMSYTDFHFGLGILNTINHYVAITTSLTFTAENFHGEYNFASNVYFVGDPDFDSSGNRLTLDIGLKLFQPPSNK